MLNHRDAKRCCFAAASLCAAQDIVAFESNGDALSLNRCWLVIFLVLDVPHDVFMQILQKKTKLVVVDRYIRNSHDIQNHSHNAQ